MSILDPTSLLYSAHTFLDLEVCVKFVASVPRYFHSSIHARQLVVVY